MNISKSKIFGIIITLCLGASFRSSTALNEFTPTSFTALVEMLKQTIEDTPEEKRTLQQASFFKTPNNKLTLLMKKQDTQFINILHDILSNLDVQATEDLNMLCPSDNPKECIDMIILLVRAGFKFYSYDMDNLSEGLN